LSFKNRKENLNIEDNQKSLQNLKSALLKEFSAIVGIIEASLFLWYFLEVQDFR
jgi:hypothetical protein